MPTFGIELVGNHDDKRIIEENFISTDLSLWLIMLEICLEESKAFGSIAFYEF